MKALYFGSWALQSDPGKQRPYNEDSGDAWLAEQALTGTLAGMFVVCDGMGGHAAGDEASRLAVKQWRHWSQNLGPQGLSPDTLDASALAALIEIHESLVIQGEKHGSKGMGTTLVSACLLDQTLCIYNVGDSGAYLCRGRECFTLHSSDNEIERQLAAGKITAEAAAQSPIRNHLIQALGYHGKITPHAARFPAKAGDRLLLCSDGLTAHVAPSEWPEILANLPDDTAAVRYLINLANQRGGSDNITVALATLKGGAPQWQERQVRYANGRKLSFRVLGSLVLGAGLLGLWAATQGQSESVEEKSTIAIAEKAPTATPSVEVSEAPADQLVPIPIEASPSTDLGAVNTSPRGQSYVFRLTLDRQQGIYVPQSLPENALPLLNLQAQLDEPSQTQALSSLRLPADTVRQNEMLGDLLIRVTRTDGHYELIIEPARPIFINREEWPSQIVHELPLDSPAETRLGIYLRRDTRPGYNVALVIPNLLAPFYASPPKPRKQKS